MTDDTNNVHQLFPDTMEKIIVREINEARRMCIEVMQHEDGGVRGVTIAHNERICVALESIAHCLARICDAVDENV